MSKTTDLSFDSEYKSWLKALKQKVLTTQLKAAVQVNSTLLAFYWELGEDIVQRQQQSSWGDGFLKQLSQDLMAEFPEIKGFSLSNIKYIRQWHLFYSEEAQKSQQLVGQLTQIPWGHNLKIISKCQSFTEALYYVRNTIEHGWSRNVLTHQIEHITVIPETTAVIPETTAVIPETTAVIPETTAVIPAKAGIYRVSSNA